MYKLLGEAVETALALKPLVANANHCEVVIAPVFVHLKTVADRLEGSNVKVAAQNCATADETFGAHRRSRRRYAERRGLLARHYRAFRAASVLRRNRRERQSKDKSGAGSRVDGDCLRRRNACGKENRESLLKSSKRQLRRRFSGFDSRRYGTYHNRLRACLGNWHW